MGQCWFSENPHPIGDRWPEQNISRTFQKSPQLTLRRIHNHGFSRGANFFPRAKAMSLLWVSSVTVALK